MNQLLLQETDYIKQMHQIVEPYLAKCRNENYFPTPSNSDSSIYCVSYLTDAQSPKGCILISHGFTETAEKYRETAYYFLQAGYHVYIPEHCGHGRSYRLNTDPSLVHIDFYERYVNDLLLTAHTVKKIHSDLPLFLYGHSMGGGIAAAAAAVSVIVPAPSVTVPAPSAAVTDNPAVSDATSAAGSDTTFVSRLFDKIILSSPMIQPATGKIPWHMAGFLARFLCLIGKSESYVPGHQPFQGDESFENSASSSKPRFQYYQPLRQTNPLFQMNAASCGWLYQSVRLNRFLLTHAVKQITVPLLLFQAGNDSFVSAKAQQKFIDRLNQKHHLHKAPPCSRLIKIAGAKHEIYNSGNPTLSVYWNTLFNFLSESE